VAFHWYSLAVPPPGRLMVIDVLVAVVVVVAPLQLVPAAQCTDPVLVVSDWSVAQLMVAKAAVVVELTTSVRYGYRISVALKARASLVINGRLANPATANATSIVKR